MPLQLMALTVNEPVVAADPVHQGGRSLGQEVLVAPGQRVEVVPLQLKDAAALDHGRDCSIGLNHHFASPPV